MSKYHIKNTLKSELGKVNKVIDKKILRGLPYTKEARYHKLLLARLSLLQKSNFLARSMRVATMFLF
jgi:hypothetical protein